MSEFDEIAATERAHAEWPACPSHFHTQYEREKYLERTAFVKGARWQHDKDRARIEELEAENARLRAALEEIVDVEDAFVDRAGFRVTCGDIARDALSDISELKDSDVQLKADGSLKRKRP